MTNSPVAGNRILVGRIAPGVLLFCLILDVSLRFIPPKFLAFRAWEAMTLFASGSGGLAPHTVYRNHRAYGDLANLGNLPRLRQYREEIFSTDARGYRNRGEVARPFSGILLLGDSFAAGAAVSDEQALSEQLQRMSGVPVYNGAKAPNTWRLIDQLGMNHGLVIWEQSGRFLLPDLVPAAHGLPGRVLRKAIGDEATEIVHRFAYSLWQYSPLEILFGRIVKSIQNDKILPNPYVNHVVAAKLRNGREILFLADEVQFFEGDWPADVSFFVDFQARLKERGMGLLVLLVPTKYEVYRDLLSPPASKEGGGFSDLVERRLNAARVPVINLQPHFHSQAQALLPSYVYLYWLDDTHWTAEGIREAAEAIGESRAVLDCHCK